MQDIVKTYQDALDSLQAAEKALEKLKQAIPPQDAQYQEFARLFLKGDMAAGAENCAKSVQDASMKIKQTVGDGIGKLPLMETYASLRAKRDVLNAHMDRLHAPGMHVTMLLQKAGAARTGKLLKQMQLDGIEDMLSTYRQEVERLSDSAVDAAAFQKAFALHTVTKQAPIQAGGKIKTGNIIQLGTYPQTKAGNDKTPIEWQVLEVRDGKALLISRYALDCQQYNTSDTNVTWETCSLRTWLNGTFKNKAFTSSELATIVTTDVTADKNPNYSTSAGNATQDRVFLLSISEANQYFTSDEARKCVLTEYAIAQGAYTDGNHTVGGKATCWWWLRSPGGTSNRTVGTGGDGSVYFGGSLVNYDSGCVRPALWIDVAQYQRLTKGESQVPADKPMATALNMANTAARFKVGNVVKFGHYPQTKAGNDKTPIDWQVLARDGTKALLISRYALDCQEYNTLYAGVTWETCSLRTWLNGTFKNKAFTGSELNSIVTTNVSADKNPNYSTSAGNATEDQVFLLSITEVSQYFSTYEARKCVPTEYAIAQGAYTSSSNTSGGKAICWWWLRSPGYSSSYAAHVHADGSVRYYGYGVYYVDGCVRPALWIDLES